METLYSCHLIFVQLFISSCNNLAKPPSSKVIRRYGVAHMEQWIYDCCVLLGIGGQTGFYRLQLTKEEIVFLDDIVHVLFQKGIFEFDLDSSLGVRRQLDLVTNSLHHVDDFSGYVFGSHVLLDGSVTILTIFALQIPSDISFVQLVLTWFDVPYHRLWSSLVKCLFGCLFDESSNLPGQRSPHL